MAHQLVGFFFCQSVYKAMEETRTLSIRGARVHNLKSVDLDIKLGEITCFAGPSGSGKTSLAFHTIMNESKRRLLNSFPNSMKFFSDRPTSVDVDSIHPVFPVFGLPQINPVIGSRSVVADTMGLTELFQTLFYKYSVDVCPTHNTLLKRIPFSHQVRKLIDIKDDDKVYLFVNRNDYIEVFSDTSFPARIYRDGEVLPFDEASSFWEVARLKGKSFERVDKLFFEKQDLVSKAIYVHIEGKEEFKRLQLKNKSSCEHCDYEGRENLMATYYSPYNALGACSSCKGYGANLEYDEDKLVDRELSVSEGGVKFLSYKPFWGTEEDLIASMKSKKIPIHKPLSELPQSFWKLLYEGDDKYCGFNELFKYLDRKKYKRNVRIYIRRIQKEAQCEKCLGSRLDIGIAQRRIPFWSDKANLLNFMSLSISELKELIHVPKTNDRVLKKITSKLYALLSMAEDIGLGHLALKRKTKTLSAGEYQRLLLLKFLGFEGSESLFIFDEPSLGLDLDEQKKLMNGFKNICAQGNTIVLIDHSKFFQQNSQNLIVMGPGAGKRGGEITYSGVPVNYFKNSPKPNIQRLKLAKPTKISFSKIEFHSKSFKNIELVKNGINWVHGKSGVGKSSIFIRGIGNTLKKKIEENTNVYPDINVTGIKGINKLEKVFIIESSLNRFTSRSTVGSITGLFSVARKHFLKTPQAKSMGLKEGHLSANSELGQCFECEGKGVKIIEMQYMEDIILSCDECSGRKIKKQYSELFDGQMTVNEAYTMPLSEMIPKIKLTPKFQRIWEYIKILKLDYLSLDRPVSSLSGGEKQRIYLLSCLLTSIEDSILFFENLSFGLSESDLEGIITFLNNLVKFNNTVVVIDSHPYFSKVCHMDIEILKNGHISKLNP
jgi:excinuclease ABC subunit A